jgi:ABC-type transport system substrate-binding protein
MISLKQVGRSIFIGSTITSTIIAVIFNPSKSNAQSIKKIEWSANASNLRGKLDQDFTFNCPSGGQTNTIYGTDLYTDDSSICTAAAHSGLITVKDGGTITIRIKPGFDFYNGNTRYEIKSNGYGNYGGSFT